jgi:predicted RNA-binding Zn ribbon-like protein
MLVMEKGPTGTAAHAFELSGGRLCLDFVNTVAGDRAAAARERMDSYAALLAWARQAGAIEEAPARRLLAEARRRPGDAAAVHRDALALREALYRTFLAAAEGTAPADADVALVSSLLGAALAHRRIARSGGSCCCKLVWDDPPGALDAPLWRVAASAAELLTSDDDLSRVRVCGLHETAECSWLFLDTTRGRTRRWCSMKDCGNKAKARRHYARAKAEG